MFAIDEEDPIEETPAAEPAVDPARNETEDTMAAQPEAIPTGDVPMPRERPKSTGAMGDITNIATEGGVGPQGPIKRILSYLMGADAAGPQEVAASSQGIDPNMPRSFSNVIAVSNAKQQGGDEAAWRLVQGHRMAFNAKQAYAYAALNGTQQKPPDLEAAIDAANKAQEHVLDGSDVRFGLVNGGVTATVTDPRTGQPQNIRLSPDQFRRYLNVGGDGQFDKLMQTGVPAALKQIGFGQAGRISQLRPMQPRQQEAIPTTEPEPEAPPATSTREKKQDRVDASDPETGYSQPIMERGQRIFPWASQSQQREQWMAREAARGEELDTRRDVARETGVSRVESALARAQGNIDQQRARNEGNVAVQQEKNKGWQYASDVKLKAAQAKVAQEAARLAATNANAAQTRALRVIQEKLRMIQPLTPQEQAIVDRFNTDAQASAAVTAPQAQQQQSAPAQAAPGKPPVPGAKFYKGQWYTRGPSGEAVPVR